MVDFAPPSTPPPPKVPDGWKAVWNEKYKEWFYVNIYTKKSQWDKPTEPIYPPEGEDEEPDGPPPYDPKKARAVGPEKSSLGSNNPFGHSGAGGSGDPNTASDEELARKLQAEEDARRPGGSRGEADTYFSDGPSGPAASQGGYANPSNDLPPRPEQQQKRGLFDKLLGKNKTSSSQQQQSYPPQQPYYPHGPPPAGQGYGYPPPGGYYPPPGGPGGYYGGGYDRPQRQGLGTGGAAALGVGGGLLGGLLLGEALDGGDGFGGDGGDYGGGGGDFGGGA